METFSQSKTMVDDHNNVKFKSLYIDMDLAMPRNSNSPRAVRRLQKSLDSHEEFEFTMSSNISMKDDIFEPAMEVASADKLFFRGQLLPLQQQQQDPSHHLAHTMVFPKKEICGQKGASLSRHYGDLLSFQLPNEENNYSCDVGFPKLQFSSQFGTCHPIMKQAANYEEGVIPSEFSLRDQIDLMRSCRLDGVFDPYKNDSRSSSFRSHQSSYWSSGEKDSRDSISSSRCSIGSYQDSCFQSAERKAPQISVIKANHPINTNANAEINECNIGVFYAKGDPKHSRNNNYGKPPIPSSNTRKWSWKGFFTGLGKASKLKADEERGDKGKVKGKGEIKEMNKRSVFTFKEIPGAMGEPASYNRRSDAGHDWEWQANTYQFVCSEGSNVKKGRKPAREDNYEDQGTVYCLRSGGRQEAASFINSSSSSSSMDNIAGEGTSAATKKEKRKVLQGNTSTWNARESWNRCVNKVKKGTRLSTYNSSSACKLQPKQLIALQGGKNMNAAMNMMNEEDQKMDLYRVNHMKAKSLSSTPLAKSPVRRAHEYNGISSGGGGYGSLYCMQGGAASLAASSSSTSASTSSTMSKTMNKKVGFAASCPASMRSSPHHSGLLAVVNKATPADLHTAIQGAIAYCKQSQAALNPS